MSGAMGRSLGRRSNQFAGQCEGGEIVRHDRHFSLVNVLGTQHATLVGQVAGSAGIFHQGAAKAQILGSAPWC